jgi:hypothetical protein
MSLYDASAYSCDSIQATTYQFVQSTYNGEQPKDFTSWAAVLDGQREFKSSTSSAASSTAATSTTTSSAPASTSASPTHTPEPAKKSTNVGAIAGGVVGGLAVVGAVVCGLVWMCLKNRRKRNSTPPTTTTQNQYPPMNQQQSPEAQPWQPQTPSPGAGVAYTPYPDPTKQGFQAQTYQQQPLLAADYNHPREGHSPPVSPVPQYSVADRHSLVKTELNSSTSPVSSPTHGHDGAQEVEARPHVPNIGRDGHPVYEVQ